MNEDPEKSFESILFPNGTDFDRGQSQAHLLDQYKLLVQTSETLVRRRDNLNTFFLSINSLLLAAIGLMAKEGFPENFGGLSIIVLGVAGIVLSISWRKLVHSYRQLNAGKFKVLHHLEKYLPASIFDAEWIALGEGKDKTKYTPFTKTETVAPWVFTGLYGITVAWGVVSLSNYIGIVCLINCV